MMLSWLIRDVFRQARATGLTVALVALTALATIVAVTARYADGRLSTFFGAVTLASADSHEQATQVLRSIVGGMAADAVGVLLALVWTAGFLPAFIDASAVSVLLAKPPGRYHLFLGKSLGVIAYVAVYALAVVALTWVGLGISTGEWPAGYWLGVPLLVAHFAAFFGFAALIAVATRSAAAVCVASLLFWAACFGMNYARHVLTTQTVAGMSPRASRAADVGYWLLPKPADFALIQADALGAAAPLPFIDFAVLKASSGFAPATSVVASLAFGLAFLALAAYEFASEDY